MSSTCARTACAAAALRCGPSTTALVAACTMPAFSQAILRMSSPRTCTCSFESAVTTATSLRRMTFVQSSRPPRPTSMICASTAASRKALKAIAVRISKVLRRPGASCSSASRTGRICSTSAAKRCGAIGLAVQPDALAEVVHVGAAEEPGALPGGAQDRFDHRRGGALALRAGDVHGQARGRDDAVLRAAQAIHERVDPVEGEGLRHTAIAGALEVGEPQDVLDGGRVVHRALTPTVPRRPGHGTRRLTFSRDWGDAAPHESVRGTALQGLRHRDGANQCQERTRRRRRETRCTTPWSGGCRPPRRRPVWAS